MLDASPLIVEKLRHHTYHSTGLHEYPYRKHHAFRSGSLRQKLAALKALDRSGLLVPESPALGGFGFELDGELYNLDTLKFYEVLIGMEQAGFLDPLRKSARPAVLEIGSGWGGFAYQFKTLFPNAAYVLVDLPQTIIFSATYLQTLFPKARVHFVTDSSSAKFDVSKHDFVFVPNFFWSALDLRPALAVNMVSFQEMTDAQVRAYVQKLADSACPRLYSLNRDRSPNNAEITSVSGIIAERYRAAEQEVLPVPYHALEMPAPSLLRRAKTVFKKLTGHTRPRGPFEYRHLRCVR